MSRASSARAAGFVGALARSHTTDTNIQGERSDLPTKMTPHEIFSLNRMDGQLRINYYADQDRETAVHPMLIPRSRRLIAYALRPTTPHIFDMLWLFDYYTIFCNLLFFSPFLLSFFCIRCHFTFVCEPLGHLIVIDALSELNVWWRRGIAAAEYHSCSIIREKSCVVSQVAAIIVQYNDHKIRLDMHLNTWNVYN